MNMPSPFIFYSTYYKSQHDFAQQKYVFLTTLTNKKIQTFILSLILLYKTIVCSYHSSFYLSLLS